MSTPPTAPPGPVPQLAGVHHSTGEAPLRVLVVDDEELARMRLSSLIRSLDAPRCGWVGEASHAAAALATLQALPCDVVLLDIAMPGLDGLGMARQLRLMGANAPAVVFVTAHAEHALQAFELEALDYLTKPVRRERLQQALLRVRRRLGPDPTAPNEASPDASHPDTSLRVVERGHVLRIPLHEVLYFKADLKYLRVRTAEGEYLLEGTLHELEARLAPRFIRVHRNALVAVHAVRELAKSTRLAVAEPGEDEAGTWVVRVAPVDEWLAVSRRQLPVLREALGLV
jgi:two-component system response regulator AlgR